MHSSRINTKLLQASSFGCCVTSTACLSHRQPATGCGISSVTLLKTLVAPVYEVVESSSFDPSGHTATDRYCDCSTKMYFLSQSCNRTSIENTSKLFARNFGKSIFGPTLIDHSVFIRGRTELWLGLFDFSGHSAFGNSLKKSMQNV
jgi:hypothetical protein